MKFWLTSERAGQIILITKGNDMKKGMRIAAAVMAAAFSMTVLAWLCWNGVEKLLLVLYYKVL